MTYIDPAGKLLAHLPRLAELQQGGTPPPINVEIDLSNRCSLGCEWCHFAHTHTRGPLAGKRDKPTGAISGGDLMDTVLACRIVDELAESGWAYPQSQAISITWTGGGEPTLHPDFDVIISLAAGKLEQGIYTHGGHIDEPRAALLKRAMTFVYVSLDAADAESYKRWKRVDRFANACDGIARLAAAEGPATVGVGYLVTRDNWRDIPKATHLAAQLGADYLQLRPTIAYTQENPGVPAEDTAWIDRALVMVEEAASYGNVVCDVERFKMYRDWAGHGYPTCWWSALQTCVTPNGKVWSCVNLREHPAAEIGDLSVESFDTIWARRPIAKVGHDCRVMCRGHIPNMTLTEIMAPREHAAFP